MDNRFGGDFAIFSDDRRADDHRVSHDFGAGTDISRPDHPRLRVYVSRRIDPKARQLARQMFDKRLAMLRIVQQIHHRVQIPFLISNRNNPPADRHRLHLQPSFGQSRDQLLLHVLIPLGFDEGEDIGFTDIKAGGFEGEKAVQILAGGIFSGGGNGQRCPAFAVLFEQMMEVQIQQKAGPVDDDETFVSKPILTIFDAARRPARHGIFAVMDGDIGSWIVPEFGGDGMGATVGADRHLTDPRTSQNAEHMFDDGAIDQRP